MVDNKLTQFKTIDMNYTPIVLFLGGMLGIIFHNLVKLDTINRANAGNVNFKKYIALERFSLLISLFVVVACVMGSHEIKQLRLAGNWLFFGFIGIGYLAQSLLVKMMGKAQGYVNNISRYDNLKFSASEPETPLYWLPADNSFTVTEFNGQTIDCSIEELVSNAANGLRFEWGGNSPYLRNVVSNQPFTINGQTTNELIGGVHSPQRPK